MNYLSIFTFAGLVSFSSPASLSDLNAATASSLKAELFQNPKVDIAGKWELTVAKNKSDLKDKELIRFFILNKNGTAFIHTTKGIFKGKWAPQKGDTLASDKSFNISISADIMLSFDIKDDLQQGYFLTIEKRGDKTVLAQDDNIWYERK